jgi:hypothetical protein
MPVEEELVRAEAQFDERLDAQPECTRFRQS